MTKKRLQNRSVQQHWRSILILFLLGLSSCAGIPGPTQVGSALHYIPEQGNQPLNRQAPVFEIADYRVAHNRIGTVRAASDSDILIDSDTPALYAEQRQFSTATADYTNLIYRAHFAEVPGGYAPYYLTAGRNVGLLVIVTLDSKGRPLLYTTLHTCGCYLSFTPTTFLPRTMLPADWPKKRQTVFGESLPAYLDYSAPGSDQQRVQIRIRPGSHRVMDIQLVTPEEIPEPTLAVPLLPLAELNRLPLENGQTTSFYAASGCRAGHVKGSFKTRERLLMSWWALDWNIGQDKYLGVDMQDGPVFYTSLKPWAREASDIRDYAKFLHYWGWNL